mmetsp:Transcript_52740/g.115046  ORF Transcript_52740/g.115046 Transcript_52740/m.115046 type:complete len:230 (-) Transcript_52740:575-1264(-)
MASAALAVGLQERAIGYMDASTTEKSRTRNAGESIAHCSAQPLAMHSSKFCVFMHGLPKKFSMVDWTAGMRTDPPKISTEWMSSMLRPDSLKAASSSFCSLATRGSHSCRNTSRSIMPLTSMSSMKHSMEIGAFGLALSTFFVFSAAVISRNHAFLLVVASILCFSFHSAAKCFASSSSKSRPPRCLSHAVERTVSLPLTNATTEQVVSSAPMSTKTTFVVLSVGRSVL